MNVHGDAAAIVFYCDRTIHQDGDINPGAEAGHGFVHAVVDYLIDQVVQSAVVRAADVHTRATAYCFAAPQDLDIIRSVLTVGAVVHQLGLGRGILCHSGRLLRGLKRKYQGPGRDRNRRDTEAGAAGEVKKADASIIMLYYTTFLLEMEVLVSSNTR